MSRKIDALVAEHVMGLGNVRFEEYYSDYVWAHSRGKKSIDVPEYSTDIAAAWGVVEKMGGCAMEVNLSGETTISFCNGVCREKFKTDDPFVTGNAKTAPMAICLAALKAKGVKYE